MDAPTAPPMGAGASSMVRPTAKPASILAADLVFEGNISGDGELLIDGAVKGDIHVARLIVGEHAHVEGVIRSGQIEVRGHVHGNIEGKAVRLLETAHVEGDITHEQLSIDVGAFFQGRCQQFRPAAQPAAQPVALHAPEPQAQPQSANVIELDHAAQR
jgi:cytoskeletal protein CcmA (bactofilin family)